VDQDGLLRIARELEARDERLAAAIAEVDALQREAEEVRGRARAFEEFLERLPLEQEAAEAALREAEREADARTRALADPEDEVGRAEDSRDPERLAAARRALVRARDAAASAGRKVARSRQVLDHLAREAESVRRESPLLERRAHELAGRLARMPRISGKAAEEPVPGLGGTIDWGDRARAALFVARSGLETERERVVREANELATSALGEAAAPTSVTLVRERLERAS
jgi:chromosome segregation ATPase